MQNFEQRYELYCEAIAEMVEFYNTHHYKMMVLKGYTCSLDWPKPEHRPCGDIDIWLFGKQKEADALLVKEKGIKIDKSHHHHTVYNWRDFMVENHYDFVNIYAHSSSAELENIFKELGEDDRHHIEVNKEIIYIPSPNLHALFLIKHMLSHFAASEINMRQVLDWAFFVENHHKKVDWVWMKDILMRYHMWEFFNIINAICVDDLCFNPTIFPSVQFLPELKERVLDDILEPQYGTAEPILLFKRFIYKLVRWRGNAWKQKLCYNESRWSAFWHGMWAKMLKPASF